MKFPKLFHTGSSGALYTWKIWTDGCEIHTEYGRSTGTKNTTCKLASPKNVGRANETTAKQQAEQEAKAMHKKKLDIKYCLKKEDAGSPLPLPMLAKKYKDRKDKIVWVDDAGLAVAHWMQPKLDGVRCMVRWDGCKLEATSRTGKLWANLGHITSQLAPVHPKGLVLDGEIYHLGLVEHMMELSWEGVPEEDIMTPFEVISKLVKKVQTLDVQGFIISTADLEYHVYDGFKQSKSEMRFTDRHVLVRDFIRENKQVLTHLEDVPTRAVLTPEDLMAYHDKVVALGYEGAMLRLNITGKHSQYLHGYRSSGLLKVKLFEDGEFLVVGFHEGVGKAKGTVIWECFTEKDRPFNTTHNGDKEYRSLLFQTGDQYVGKLLKISFFGRTGLGKPRHPNGLGFRLEEDM